MLRIPLHVDTPNHPAAPVNGLCPHCNRDVSFNPIAGVHDVKLRDEETQEYYIAGQRTCNSPGCNAQVFVIGDEYDSLIVYPTALPSIGADGVPESIESTFNEALECAANQNFRAAAIMVRRTLEELCNERGAVGTSLMKRLESLKDKVTLPPPLFDAMTNIRLLGNDAAHIEAATYEQVNQNEVQVAIEFTREILRAVYHFSEMLKSMNNLKVGTKPSE